MDNLIRASPDNKWWSRHKGHQHKCTTNTATHHQDNTIEKIQKARIIKNFTYIENYFATYWEEWEVIQINAGPLGVYLPTAHIYNP